MEISQFYHFICVVEKKTYQEAAETLHLSQSSLSKSIMRMEDELGIKVFNRDRRKVALTKYGIFLYREAKGFVEHYERIRGELDQMRRDEDQVLRIATLPFTAAYGINDALAAFSRETGIAVDLTEVEDDGIPLSLENGWDMAITRAEHTALMGCRSQVIARDRLVLVVGAEDPLAAAEEVDLAALSGADFVFMHRNTGIYRTALGACRQAGFKPEKVRCARIETILDLVRKGRGVSLLMEQALTAFNMEGLVPVPLARPVPSEVILMAGEEEAEKKSARALFDFFKKCEKAY